MMTPQEHPSWCTRDEDETTWHRSTPFTIPAFAGWGMEVQLTLAEQVDVPRTFVEMILTWQQPGLFEHEPPDELLIPVEQAEVVAADMLRLTARALAS